MSEEIIDDVIAEPVEEIVEDPVEEINEPEPEPEKVPKGVQKRIDEITREKYEERRERQRAQERADRLEAELAAIRNGAQQQQQRQLPNGAPDPDQYPAGRYDPDYLEALTDFKVQARFEAQREQASLQQRKMAIQEAEAKAKVESDLAELQSSFEATKLQLDQISQEVSAKAAVDLFNSRMNFLDDQYDFSAQELELVTAEVMSVESTEEAFEAYKGKLSIIFAHKLKSTIAAQEAEVKARIEEAIAKRLDVSKASEETEDSEEDELEIEEEEEVSIPNNNAQASTRTSLVERLKSNFSVEVTN